MAGHIEMRRADQIKEGDVFSTDGGIVTYVGQHVAGDDSHRTEIYIETVCHGIGKEGIFPADKELPLWVRD